MWGATDSPAASTPLYPVPLDGEVALNQQVKDLIQKLGEAIHESVAESEHISGVVQEIREQGFDVLLMLEGHHRSQRGRRRNRRCHRRRWRRECRRHLYPKRSHPSSSRCASPPKNSMPPAGSFHPTVPQRKAPSFCGIRKMICQEFVPTATLGRRGVPYPASEAECMQWHTSLRYPRWFDHERHVRRPACRWRR